MEGWDDLFNDVPTPEGLRCIRRDLLDQPIATVMDSEQASRHYLAFMRREIDGPTLDEYLLGCILEEGMSKAQILAAFPPEPAFPNKPHPPFNMTALIATILWQEWKRVGARRPKGNIRHFWYTHLMYTLTRVMGETNIASIMSTYNKVLGQLVRQENFRYSDLNFVSIKTKLCEAIFEDSPYPHLILACEKESYHTYLKRLAHVFHVTFISLGGQSSYGAFEDLVFQFMDYGIDLDQEFRLLVITDYDPHGYDIQEGAKKHLEDAGIRRVTIARVYLCPEHITDGIVDRFAVPYDVDKPKPESVKAACTLYNKFGAKTGGIYKRRTTGERVHFHKNGNGSYQVPQLTDGPGEYALYRVELDNFDEHVLIDLMIDALEHLIDGAEYYYQAAKTLWRRTIQQGTYHAAKAIIQRAVQQKTQPVERILRDLRDRLADRWDELTADEQTLIERVQDDASFQVDALQQRIDELQEQIDDLQEQLDDLEHQQRAYRVTEDDVVDFLHAVQRRVVPNIPAAQEQLELIDEGLTTYGDSQEELQREEVRSQFTTEPVAIRDVVDFSQYAHAVFHRAREGDERFQAVVPYVQHERVTSAAEDDLASQQESITVEVPDLPDSLVEIIDTGVQAAETHLTEADRNVGNLPERWLALMRRLIRHYINNEIGWNPWDNWDNGGWR